MIVQNSPVQPLFWQSVISVMVAVAFMAWAYSQVRKAIKGEEVPSPIEMLRR